MFDQGFTAEDVDTEASVARSPEASAAQASGPHAFAAAQASALAPLPPPERLVALRHALDGRIVFTHGFGIEGQLIFHWICERGLAIEAVTLDTGRLFPETYALWTETERRYGRRIHAIYPHQLALEALVARQGIDGFYESKTAREACCSVRKVRPLDRALGGARAWITGARADQTAARKEAGLIGYDESRGLIKFNPLFDWTRDAVRAAVEANRIPVNALHARGFASIGCAPCTRTIQPGERERSGRWWWEQENNRECGLHLPRAGTHGGQAAARRQTLRQAALD